MTIPAIPTTYKGVNFRSKSEAVFARAMDIIKIPRWEYQPKEHTLGGWYVPDFLVQLRPQFPEFLVEYKPAEPADHYVRDLLKAHADYPLPLAIIWASPYERGRGVGMMQIARMDNERWKWESAAMWFGLANRVFGAMKEASAYRFDLKEPGGPA